MAAVCTCICVSPKEISRTIVRQLGRLIVGRGIIFSSTILYVRGGVGDNVTMTSNEPKVRMCVLATRGVFVGLKKSVIDTNTR